MKFIFEKLLTMKKKSFLPSLLALGALLLIVFAPSLSPAQPVSRETARRAAYPTTGQGSYTYTHSTYGEQSVNFGETTYDWDNMPNAISGNSSQTSIDAVATLIYHCGVAVDMNYGTGGSGASSTLVPAALIDYFRYAPSASYVSRDAFDDAHWIAFLKTELDDSRPLYYSGSNANSGHASAWRHAFCCSQRIPVATFFLCQ